MNWKSQFRDRPIRQKVMIITMVTTTAALLIAGLGIILADSILFRKGLERSLTTLAKIIADNSTAAVAFGDPDTASETLSTLRNRTHIESACIFGQDGTVLAKYLRQAEFKCPPSEKRESVRFSDKLTVAQPIMLNGRRIGTLMMLYDLGELNERVRLYSTTVIGVLLGATLLAFLLSSYLRDIIATPIARLVKASTAVAETGDYGIRAQKSSSDELGVLVDHFNGMLSVIQLRDNQVKKALSDRETAFQEAESERARFHFMAESMPQKIFAAGPNGESIYLNRLWMDFTGLTFDQLKEWGWMKFIHPDDIDESLRVWKQAVETGDPLQLTNRFRRADGVYRWHLNRARAMRNSAGEITLWIGSSTEIHEQKEREEELRRANDDLQQFAYSASHDLQEPIRNVAVYSEIVARRYEHLLDADGQLYLGFLKEGGRRLATLVNDLLAYTRASRAELSETPTDSGAVLNDAVAMLAEAIRESHATVTYDPLPEVRMGEAHLQQVFQNLISNALKYRSEAAPRIHVSATSLGAYWYFSLRDNGIGIDPQYKEKIFGVFKRLHHEQKYSGTGIGLAICQRVVERYGGRIWVESELGSGATFFFTIPNHAEAIPSAALQLTAGRGQFT